MLLSQRLLVYLIWLMFYDGDSASLKPCAWSVPSEAVLRIKEIISEDVLRSALSGGRHVPVFPPLTLYPQPPRAAGPPAMPRLSNPASAQGHRPAAPHSGVGIHKGYLLHLAVYTVFLGPAQLIDYRLTRNWQHITFLPLLVNVNVVMFY